MRPQLCKKHFTRAERIVGEILKSNHIPFRSKVLINNKEIDFLVGEYAIEIDGHTHSGEKNDSLLKAGFIPVQFTNAFVIKHRDILETQLKDYGLRPSRYEL